MMNTIMNVMLTKNKSQLFLILVSPFFVWSGAHSAELTGRFSMLGSTANATQGDIGYVSKDNLLTADQQSLRLMLDDTGEKNEWSVHLKMARVHTKDFPSGGFHSSDFFRYDKLSHDWLKDKDINSTTSLGYQLDRAVYKHRFKNSTLSIGRQPIDWGSGRFWQPLNVFGSFSPTDLDTDFKPGIDAVSLDWFPSDFSSLTAVYAFSEKDNALIENKNSAAIHYRRQVGEVSEIKIVAGNIIGSKVFGAAFESSTASGMGWRVEAAATNVYFTKEDVFFFIAGLDYQFSNGLLLTAEWYNNSRGFNSVSSLLNANLTTDPLLIYGLQQQLNQDVFGISLNKEISPLLNGSYTLLASPLKDVSGKLNTSLLHQFSLRYSVSDESDLLFSMQFANGTGLNSANKAQSEFGHIPTSLTIRLRFYF